MTAPECPTCNGSSEVPVNPDAAWSGHVQALTFTACPECAGASSAGWLRYLERTEPCDCDLGGMGRRTDCELHGEAS